MKIVVTVKLEIEDFDGRNKERNPEEIRGFVDTLIVAGLKGRPQMEEHSQWSVEEITWNFEEGRSMLKDIKCKKCGARMDIKPLGMGRNVLHCSFCSYKQYYELDEDGLFKRLGVEG